MVRCGVYLIATQSYLLSIADVQELHGGINRSYTSKCAIERLRDTYLTFDVKRLLKTRQYQTRTGKLLVLT